MGHGTGENNASCHGNSFHNFMKLFPLIYAKGQQMMKYSRNTSLYSSPFYPSTFKNNYFINVIMF